jgi:hypothetical protein
MIRFIDSHRLPLGGATASLRRTDWRAGSLGSAPTEDIVMHREGDEVHITTDEARGGETGHGVRYVLAIGLGTAIVALSAIWIFQALAG